MAEYKVNNDNPELIWEYISALSNSETICGYETVYMLWVVDGKKLNKNAFL